MNSLSQAAAIAGTMAFAATAVLAIAPRRIDLLTAMVMGVMTAIGGGTVRDLILDQPVFWAKDLSYLWISLAASIATFYGHRLLSRKRLMALLLYLDAVGIALFAIQGSQKGWRLGFGLPLAPILLGIMTAIGGGLIRDVLAGRENLLMKRELYAIPVSAGCVAYAVLMTVLPQYDNVIAVACMGFIVLFRGCAIHWRLEVPDWLKMTTGQREPEATIHPWIPDGIDPSQDNP